MITQANAMNRKGGTKLVLPNKFGFCSRENKFKEFATTNTNSTFIGRYQMTYKWMGCYLQRGRQRGYHRPLRYYCTTTFLILGPLSLSAPVSSEGRKNIPQYLTFFLIVVSVLSLQYLSVFSWKLFRFRAKWQWELVMGSNSSEYACQMFRALPLALKLFKGFKL